MNVEFDGLDGVLDGLDSRYISQFRVKGSEDKIDCPGRQFYAFSENSCLARWSCGRAIAQESARGDQVYTKGDWEKFDGYVGVQLTSKHRRLFLL